MIAACMPRCFIISILKTDPDYSRFLCKQVLSNSTPPFQFHLFSWILNLKNVFNRFANLHVQFLKIQLSTVCRGYSIFMRYCIKALAFYHTHLVKLSLNLENAYILNFHIGSLKLEFLHNGCECQRLTTSLKPRET